MLLKVSVFAIEWMLGRVSMEEIGTHLQMLSVMSIKAVTDLFIDKTNTWNWKVHTIQLAGIVTGFLLML